MKHSFFTKLISFHIALSIFLLGASHSLVTHAEELPEKTQGVEEQLEKDDCKEHSKSDHQELNHHQEDEVPHRNPTNPSRANIPQKRTLSAESRSEDPHQISTQEFRTQVTLSHLRREHRGSTRMNSPNNSDDDSDLS